MPSTIPNCNHKIQVPLLTTCALVCWGVWQCYGPTRTLSLTHTHTHTCLCVSPLTRFYVHPRVPDQKHAVVDRSARWSISPGWSHDLNVCSCMYAVRVFIGLLVWSSSQSRGFQTNRAKRLSWLLTALWVSIPPKVRLTINRTSYWSVYCCLPCWKMSGGYLTSTNFSAMLIFICFKKKRNFEVTGLNFCECYNCTQSPEVIPEL